MFPLARICAAGPGQGFFFGGFDFGLGEGYAVFAGGFGAEALGLLYFGCCLGRLEVLHVAQPTSNMRSRATRAQCLTLRLTWIWLTTRPSTRFSRAQARCCGLMRYMVVQRQPESSRVMIFLPSAAKRLARRLTRWISVPMAKVEPDGASSTIWMRRSVLPRASAFWQTSQRHSGWTMTWMPGYFART